MQAEEKKNILQKQQQLVFYVFIGIFLSGSSNRVHNDDYFLIIANHSIVASGENLQSASHNANSVGNINYLEYY